MKFSLRRVLIVICWLVLWQILYLTVNNTILMSGPAETAAAFFALVRTAVFWTAVLNSLGKILAGFFSGYICGFLLASSASKKSLLRDFLSPAISLCKSVPVASFVILALLIAGSSYLSVLISFIIVFPQVYTAVLSGYSNTDQKLAELADIYRMPRIYRFAALYLPALSPFLLSSFRVSLGMAWKSGIAAEVIGAANSTMGEQLYLAKLYLDTSRLFAYTAAIIILSALSEALLSRCFGFVLESKGIFGKNFHRKSILTPESSELQLTNICKSFGSRTVLSDISLTVSPQDAVCIMGESGSGKSTLLRIIARILDADSGSVTAQMINAPGIVFQDDRLFEELTPAENIRLISAKSDDEIKAHLLCLLDEKSLQNPVSSMSGGMKRRVCICRAVISESNILILDEPFSALDDFSKEKTAEYIREYRKDRALVMTTHQRTDADLLSASVYMLSSEGLKKQ